MYMLRIGQGSTSRYRKLERINQGKLYFVGWLFFRKHVSWTYLISCWGKEVGKRDKVRESKSKNEERG